MIILHFLPYMRTLTHKRAFFNSKFQIFLQNVKKVDKVRLFSVYLCKISIHTPIISIHTPIQGVTGNGVFSWIEWLIDEYKSYFSYPSSYNSTLTCILQDMLFVYGTEKTRKISLLRIVLELLSSGTIFFLRIPTKLSNLRSPESIHDGFL